MMNDHWIRSSSGSVIVELAESLKGMDTGEHPKFTADDFAFKGKVLTEFSRLFPDLRHLINQLRKKDSHLADQAATFLNDAIQPSVARHLGLVEQGTSLSDIFKEVRRILKQQNKKLVLIFEDLVENSVVTSPIYQQFITQPDADLAPLVAMYAITNEP